VCRYLGQRQGRRVLRFVEQDPLVGRSHEQLVLAHPGPDTCGLCVAMFSVSLQHRPVLASAVVVVLGLLLSITGFLLLMALEYMPDLPSRYVCAPSMPV
jgi:hypothetical protein